MTARPRPLIGPAARGGISAESPAAPDTLLPAGPPLADDDDEIGLPTVVALTLIGVVLVVGYLSVLRWAGGQ